MLLEERAPGRGWDLDHPHAFESPPVLSIHADVAAALMSRNDDDPSVFPVNITAASKRGILQYERHRRWVAGHLEVTRRDEDHGDVMRMGLDERENVRVCDVCSAPAQGGGRSGSACNDTRLDVDAVFTEQSRTDPVIDCFVAVVRRPYDVNRRKILRLRSVPEGQKESGKESEPCFTAHLLPLLQSR